MRSSTERTHREFSTSDLAELQRQLSAWRRRQRGRAQLPEALWRAAATLTRSLGVSRVSRTLRLDYYKLSRWTDEPVALSSDSPRRASFVELALSAPRGPDTGQDYRAELSESSGRRMTLHLGGDLRAVTALAEAFWRRGS